MNLTEPSNNFSNIVSRTYEFKLTFQKDLPGMDELVILKWNGGPEVYSWDWYKNKCYSIGKGGHWDINIGGCKGKIADSGT